MRLPADVVCVWSVKSKSKRSLTQCARLCLSVCGRSARSQALSDSERASIGAASDIMTGKTLIKATLGKDRERERCKADMGKERENDSTHE